MYPHRIRLRGPWECTPITAVEEAPRRVTLPCRWPEAGLAGFRGAAWFRRKFGYPGRIDSFERVWLTCAGCTGCREVRLNGHRLAQEMSEEFSFDVTALLAERNQLEILVQGDSDTAGCWGEISLEIRCQAYLAGVQLERTQAGLRLTGSAVGTASQALELYTLVDGQHVDYRTIQPSVDGQSFSIDLPANLPLPSTVRVELIHVSTIWYTAELSLQK